MNGFLLVLLDCGRSLGQIFPSPDLHCCQGQKYRVPEFDFEVRPTGFGRVALLRCFQVRNLPGSGVHSTPTDVIDLFRRFYGPTIDAFEAAQKTGSVEEL